MSDDDSLVGCRKRHHIAAPVPGLLHPQDERLADVFVPKNNEWTGYSAYWQGKQCHFPCALGYAWVDHAAR